MKSQNLLMFRERVVAQLKASIKENLGRYRTGDFNFVLSDATNLLDCDKKIDLAFAEQVTASSENQNELNCCLAVYRALPGLTPYLARDERLWVYLTHIHFLNYSRIRWEIPDDDERAISHIKTHFFATGARGIERDNAISRLWWMSLICSRVERLSLERTLQVFLHQSDVRANIVERPTTSQNVSVLSSVIEKLEESYATDKALYERERFRLMMKELNLKGGIKLLEVLDLSEVKKLVTECADS